MTGRPDEIVPGLVPGVIPSPEHLEAFAASAARAGRALVVGAVVVDDRGRVFVQRRSMDRAIFPGCWDLVGGHAEAGESVRAALEREVREETGWRLAEIGPLVTVLDWEAKGEPKREIDLVVRVEGDLARPRLEPGKHDGGRWLAEGDEGVLLERRDPDDRFVYEVVVGAFRVLGRSYSCSQKC